MGERRRVVLRDRARRDVEAAVDWYRSTAGEATALDFVDALEDALRHVGRHPESGSARYSVELRIPALRYWRLDRVPYLVFYVEGGGMVSYYQADAIGTPIEGELIAGVGAQVDLGKGWWLDIAARARHPAGNGNDHDTPEHAPHGTKAEFVLGVKKDF